MTQNVFDLMVSLVKDKRDFDPNDTLKLLKMYGSKYWSWSVSSVGTIKKTKGLVLKVNGHHHKGYVFITLDCSDTYTVYIITTRGEILNTYEMVYFDMLFDTIDKRIEWIPEYEN